MKRNIKTIAITLAVLATNTFAGELSLQLHGLSWHAQPRSDFERGGREWNERNVGLGVRNTFSEEWSVQAGFFRNSIDRTTVYAIASYTPLKLGAVRAGGFAGVGSGYRNAPLLAGGLLEVGPVSLRIIPPIKNLTPLTIGGEVGVKF